MKTLSTHAQAAKMIRQELKKAFPLIKFTVTSSSYSGGTSIDVDWVDGPIRDRVQEVIGKYQYGYFNGMEDIYETTNRIDGLPQVKFVMSRREISETIYNEVYEVYKKSHSGWEDITSLDQTSTKMLKMWGCWTPRNYIYRELCKMDLTHGYKQGV